MKGLADVQVNTIEGAMRGLALFLARTAGGVSAPWVDAFIVDACLGLLTNRDAACLAVDCLETDGLAGFVPGARCGL